MSERAVDTLSRFLVTTTPDDIPERLYARAMDCVLDVLGAAIAGLHTTSYQSMRRALMQFAGPGKAGTWFAHGHTNPVTAATVNAMAATALDIDDGHRMAAGHPGVAVISAAIAAAEAENADFRTFLTSIILGYEAAVRIALARNPEHHKSTVSGRWSGTGSAAAFARINGFSAAGTTQAILIAEQHAPRNGSAIFHGFAGSDVKESIAWSTYTGITGALLAREGFKGYPDTFDNGVLYDAGMLVEDLGRSWAIDGLFFKPYACCRWIHAAIEGALRLQAENTISASRISSITIATFLRAFELDNKVTPHSQAEAQFSVPFCIAAALVHGPKALMPIADELFDDPAVQELAARIVVRHEPDLTAMFPKKAPSDVTIKTTEGTYEIRIIDAHGDPLNPMSRSDLQDKFRIFADDIITPDLAERIIAVFDSDRVMYERALPEVLDFLYPDDADMSWIPGITTD